MTGPQTEITVPTIIDAICDGALEVLDGLDVTDEFASGFRMALRIVSGTVHEFDHKVQAHNARHDGPTA